MTDTFIRIKEHADATRKWAESYAIAKKFPKNLNGMCAIASSKLFEALDRVQGLKPELAIWHDRVSEGVHCFVLCNEYLVDITATQFGNFDPVEIINRFKIDKRRYYFWNFDTRLKSIDDLILYQQEIPWVAKSQVTERVLSWRG